MIETYLERCAREKRERAREKRERATRAEEKSALARAYESALMYGTGYVYHTAKNNPPRVNVYDAVNRDRLLGSHPRWSAVDNYLRYATLARCSPAYNSSLMYVSNLHGTVKADDILTVDTVELKRETRVSKDGWEAEVILVTYSPLEHLMRLKDFRLPGDQRSYYERTYY